MTPDKVEAALGVLRWLASDNWNGLVPSMPMPEVLSVLTEALAERGWRPIDEAPREIGVPMRFWRKEWPVPLIGFYRADRDLFCGCGLGWAGHRDNQPTHFQLNNGPTP